MMVVLKFFCVDMNKQGADRIFHNDSARVPARQILQNRRLPKTFKVKVRKA